VLDQRSGAPATPVWRTEPRARDGNTIGAESPHPTSAPESSSRPVSSSWVQHPYVTSPPRPGQPHRAAEHDKIHRGQPDPQPPGCPEIDGQRCP
jgi:hypothetical protein